MSETSSMKLPEDTVSPQYVALFIDYSRRAIRKGMNWQFSPEVLAAVVRRLEYPEQPKEDMSGRVEQSGLELTDHAVSTSCPSGADRSGVEEAAVIHIAASSAALNVLKKVFEAGAEWHAKQALHPMQRIWELTRHDAGGFSMEWIPAEREWQLSLRPLSGIPNRTVIARGPKAEGVIDHALQSLESLDA